MSRATGCSPCDALLRQQGCQVAVWHVIDEWYEFGFIPWLCDLLPSFTQSPSWSCFDQRKVQSDQCQRAISGWAKCLLVTVLDSVYSVWKTQHHHSESIHYAGVG